MNQAALAVIRAELLDVRAQLVAANALPATIALGRLLQRVVELLIERDEIIKKGP